MPHINNWRPKDNKKLCTKSTNKAKEREVVLFFIGLA